MTNVIARVVPALEQLAALGAALPGRGGAGPGLLGPLAAAGLSAGLGAGGAGARVAGQGAGVEPAGQEPPAFGAAGPGRGGAALDRRGGLAAVAGHLYSLRTGGAGSCNQSTSSYIKIDFYKKRVIIN